MAANLGLLTPASAQATSNLVFLTSDTSNIINTAKAAFQTEATARGLNFVDGTGLLAGSGTLPVDANTKILVLFSYTTAISASSIAQLTSIFANNPGLEVIAFIDDGSVATVNNVWSSLQPIVPASWTATVGPKRNATGTPLQLNTLSAYATPSLLAALPSFSGTGYYSFLNVPTDDALYVDTTAGATATPTTSNVYTLFLPHALSSGGQGACVFLTFDSSPFGVEANIASLNPAQSNAIAHGFVSAGLDTNGACGIQPTLQVTKTADSTAALTPGGTVHYTITVTNTSPADASAVQVSDPLPAGIASYTWTCSDAACPNPSGSTPLNDETIAILSAGQSVTYLITATVDSAPPATVTNTVSLSGTGFVCVDATGTTQPCTAQADNPSVADMQGIAPASVSATVGKPVSVPLTCTNNGPDAAVNATCTVTGAPADAKTVCSPAVPVVSLAVNQSITCTVTFTPTTTDTLTLTVTAGTDSQDADHTNDAQSVDITPVAGQNAGLPATPVPTLTDIALIVLTLLLGLSALAVHRRGR